MRSMTGYGRGETHWHGFKFTVELNSVNRKQSEISVDIQRDLIELEPRIRDEINTLVSRGRLHVVVAFHRESANGGSHVRLNESLARTYLSAIRKLKKDLKLTGEVSVETLLRFPGVLQTQEPEIDPESVWPHLEKALTGALKKLIAMREKEGTYLRRELLKRLKLIESRIGSIEKMRPQIVDRYRGQLHQRIQSAGIELNFEDERLLKEVALFADRCDITEEITRLRSHFKQVYEQLFLREPVGRTLDFLAQEMNREINTIGAKANHAEVSQHVVQMKAELEKIREQIQNIE
jgi:uncharacterized protein (TIGR00255 family)